MNVSKISARNAISIEQPDLPFVRVAGATVVAITLAIFCRCIFFDFCGWDDVLIIAGNPRFNPPTLQSVWFYWTHPGFNLYQPVTYTLWAAIAKISVLPYPDSEGLWFNPYIFHFAGLLCHLFATAAVYGILITAIRSVPAVALGTLAFAIHPLMTEPVAFIGAMNTPLAAALALSAAWLHLSRESSAAGSRRRGRLLLAAALYGLALLAKPTAVVVPLLVVCIEIGVLRFPPRHVIASITPWILITIPCLVWTRLFQSGATQTIPFWAHLWISGHAAGFYVGKIIWPIPLAVDYGKTPAWLLSHPTTAILCLIPTALLLLAWFYRRRFPAISVAMFLYLLMLLPNSGLVSFDYQRVSNVADRYAYLAMVAFALGVTSILSNTPPGITRKVAYGATITVLVFWAVLTTFQLRVWRNGIALFTHAVEVNPRSSFCYQCLAQVDLTADDPTAALVAATRSIELNPANDQFQPAIAGRDPTSVIPPLGYASAWAEAAQAHIARGNALDLLNRLNEAANEFTIATQMNPGNIIAFTDLALAMAKSGHEAQAKVCLRRALQIDPAYAPARAALQQIQNHTSRG